MISHVICKEYYFDILLFNERTLIYRYIQNFMDYGRFRATHIVNVSRCLCWIVMCVFFCCYFCIWMLHWRITHINSLYIDFDMFHMFNFKEKVSEFRSWNKNELMKSIIEHNLVGCMFAFSKFPKKNRKKNCAWYYTISPFVIVILSG